MGGLLAVNSSSGLVYVSGVIDREHPTLTRMRDTLRLTVQVPTVCIPALSSTLLRLTVQVLPSSL